MQPNTVISILSLNGPIPKSDYKLQSKPTWERMEIWVLTGVCTFSSILALVMAASGISPGPDKSSFTHAEEILQRDALNSIHVASLESRMVRGLKILSEKMKKEVLEGRVELRNQPTRKSSWEEKRERKENKVHQRMLRISECQ